MMKIKKGGKLFRKYLINMFALIIIGLSIMSILFLAIETTRWKDEQTKILTNNTEVVADSIEDFVGKLNIDTNISYYALNMFVHGRRECRYIRNKPDNMIKVFDSLDDALKAGFQKCNNPNCFL